MPPFPYLAAVSTIIKRAAGIAALTGAVMLATPLTPAFAQTETPESSHQIPERPAVAARHPETLEQRINSLHAQLKITSAEESAWQAVAQTMRDNAAALQKLVTAKSAQKNKTAVDDLQTYELFAEAHVEGLKKLIGTFQILYDAMPAQQQKLADQVFQHSRG